MARQRETARQQDSEIRENCAIAMTSSCTYTSVRDCREKKKESGGLLMGKQEHENNGRTQTRT